MSSTLISLLLAAWAVAIVLFVYVKLIDRFLWIEVVLAVAGVFGAILPLAISPFTALVINAITLILFIISLEMFKARPAGGHDFHGKLGFEAEVSVVLDREIHRPHLLTLAPLHSSNVVAPVCFDQYSKPFTLNIGKQSLSKEK